MSTTHSKIDRLVRAYRPLHMRGSLVEGLYRRPASPPTSSRPRMALLALVAVVLRRGQP